MSSLHPTAAQLQRFALFSDLTLDECETLTSCFQLNDYSAGSMLIQQDDLSTHLYLIVEGIVEVRLPLVGAQTTTRVAKFGPGECVGELALARVSDTHRAEEAKRLVETFVAAALAEMKREMQWR